MQPAPHPEGGVFLHMNHAACLFILGAVCARDPRRRMKRSLTLAAVVLLISPFLALAGDTAYDALRAVGTRFGTESQTRLMEIAGKSGRPQPAVWQVQIEDPAGKGGPLQVNVQRGAVVGQSKATGGMQTGRLNLATIQLDSDGAFAIANTEAIRCEISFDRLNYLLKLEGGFPVWRVELFDGPGKMVGYLKIAADTGNVIERSPQLALSEEDRKESKWSKPGEKFKSVADFFHRAGKKVERTGYQLRNWANGDGWTDAKNP